MEGLMVDGFHGMSSAYFLGCMAEEAPTSRVDAPAVPASEGVGAARNLPIMAHSFRKRPRKQTMLTTRALDTMNRALDAGKEDDDRRNKLAATQKQAAEEAKEARHERQAATRKHQEVRAQLQQQQAQALDVTRATQKATAAAARKATVDVVVEAHKSNQSTANLPQFVWVPTSGLSRCTSSSTSSCSSPKSSGYSRVQGSTAGQGSSQKDSLTLSPTTPVRECVKLAPGSPITTDSLPDMVATGSTAGGKGQPGLCHFCHKTSSPAWRRGSAQPYQGLQLCNGCGIWEDRYGSLTACNKAGKSRQAVLARQPKWSAGNGVVLSQQECQAVPGADQGSEVALGDKRGKVAQTRAKRHASAVSCSAGGQPVQREQVGFANEESRTEAVPNTSRKQTATSSLLQRTVKRGAEVQPDIGKGAAVATEGGRGVLEGAYSHAANAGTVGGGSNNMVVDGGSRTCQQGRGLRKRKYNTVIVQV